MNKRLNTDSDPMVAVLDVKNGALRPLSSLVDDMGLTATEYQSRDALLSTNDSPAVILVAFEQLWPGPEESLREIRSATGQARIVVALAPESSRARLARRLWESGACDYIIDRSASVQELAPILRQALVDSPLSNPLPRHSSANQRIRSLTNFATALATHDRVDDILKVLHHRFSMVVPYRVLSLLLLVERPRLYMFQRGKADHVELMTLSRDVCATANTIKQGNDYRAEDFQMISGGRPLPTDPDIDPNDPISVCLPLLGGGECVGSIGILSDSAHLDPESVHALELTVNHLASALRFAFTLQRVRRDSITDPLTGLFNRRHLEHILEEEFARAGRYKLELCCIMIDVDHFKRVNDLYGHSAGDAVLRNVAGILRSVVRLNDSIFRYGGEEFLVLLPETTVAGATSLFERIRFVLATSSLMPGSSLQDLAITVSGGLACYPDSRIESPMDLVELADKALLKAKASGRDRLLVGTPTKTEEKTKSPGEEKRVHERVDNSLEGEFIPIGDVAMNAIPLVTQNLSAGGAAVIDSRNELRRNGYGLFFIGESKSPFFAQVTWARGAHGKTLAGLEFVSPRGTVTPVLEEIYCLLMVANEEKKTSVSRIVLAQGIKVSAISSKEELEDLDVGDYRIVIIDESAMATEMGKALVDKRQDSDTPLELVILGETGLAPTPPKRDHDSISLLKQTKADHLIAETSLTRSLFAALSKVTAGRRFGVRHYLLPGARVHRWRVSSVKEKRRALAGVRAMAEEVAGNDRIIDHVLAGLDEMMINAMRASKATSARPVLVEAGYDSEMLALGVLDECGGLNRAAVFDSLARSMRSKTFGLESNSDSASLGFRIMLDSLNHVVVNVEPGKCTEIIGLAIVHNSLRKFRESKSGISLLD